MNNCLDVCFCSAESSFTYSMAITTGAIRYHGKSVGNSGWMFSNFPITAFCEILGLVILNLAIAFSLYEVALFFIKSAQQNKKLRQLSENLHKIHPVQSIRLKGGYLQDRAKKLWSSSEDNKDVEKKKKSGGR